MEWEWDSGPELTKMKDRDRQINEEIPLRLGIQGIKSEFLTGILQKKRKNEEKEKVI